MTMLVFLDLNSFLGRALSFCWFARSHEKFDFFVAKILGCFESTFVVGMFEV